ncbi:MAG: EAL domain-containing protein [Rubrobacter sp.]|nr:EAL domain-containing protein [Rubrobacter sp.]
MHGRRRGDHAAVVLRANARKGRYGVTQVQRLHLSCSGRGRAVAGGPSLVEVVTTALSESGLQPEDLGLEITESIMMEESATAEVMLRTLKDRGVKLALDDFRSGYSSLAYLMKIPVSILKTDRSLIAGVDKSSEGSAIVSSMINLAHALKLMVVAEGVETAGETGRAALVGMRLRTGLLLADAIRPATAAADPQLTLRTGPGLWEMSKDALCVLGNPRLRFWPPAGIGGGAAHGRVREIIADGHQMFLHTLAQLSTV